MPYALLEKEIERLDEAQQNAVVQFVRFLLSQNSAIAPQQKSSLPWDAFDRIMAKAAIDHRDHEWTMEEIDAEIAASRKERRERRLVGTTA